MSYDGPPIKQVTDDFVECFSDPANQTSVMARLSATIMLPAGVDPDDQRVVEILQQIRDGIAGDG